MKVFIYKKDFLIVKANSYKNLNYNYKQKLIIKMDKIIILKKHKMNQNKF